jgi:hypothetical protein
MTVNPWNVQPAPTKGDARKAPLYRSIGQALSNWEFYETTLFLVFKSVTNPGWEAPLESAYGSILAHKGRAEMVSSALATYFTKFPVPHQMAFATSLLNRGGNFAARRNEIAHGRVLEYFDKSGKRNGFVVRPAIYALNKQELTGFEDRKVHPLLPASSKMILRPKYAYNSEQIDAFGKAFFNLGTEAGEFALDLLDKGESRDFPKSLKPIAAKLHRLRQRRRSKFPQLKPRP